MSEVTAPIMTDATGQSIDSKLNSLLGKMDNLAAAFQPNASGIAYSNTTSGLTGDNVQEAIDEVAADITEINTNLSYKLLHSDSYNAGAQPEIDMPANWEEMNVQIGIDGVYFVFVFQILRVSLVANNIYRQGYYVSSSDSARAHFKYLSTDKIKITDAQANGSNKNYTVKIYYR